MKAENKEKHHINGFDSLRGLMALWVAAAHTFMTFDMNVPSSIKSVLNVAFAVDVFIILSGFVIFLLLDTQREKYVPFIVRRAFRLFPVYLIALFISAFTIEWQIEVWKSIESSGRYFSGRLNTLEETYNNFWPHLSAHLFLLQGLFSETLKYSDYTFLEPAWSLSLEWQFYLVAPLLFYSYTNTKKQIWLVLFAITMAATYGFFDAGYLSNNLHFFIVGMASYYMFKHRDTPLQKALPLVILCIAITLRSVPLTIWFATFYGLIGSSWFCNITQRVLNVPALVYLGKISYPIYVIHTLCIYPMYVLMDVVLTAPSSIFATIAGTLVLTISLSAVIHHWIEIPLIKHGKALSKSLGKWT
ncbi:acyltransferase [Alteromonas sp. MTD1]|jgi:peptidoglycan/LPS O-acetylase OafA/YrhL|uniref:acyltransferase family protein n=1 Tax=Alteromonas sp. MTD1 TaxID=3057962 RepID=UPI0036F2810B